MSAAKAGKYVLLANVLKQRDEDGAPVRYVRGDTVTLTARQATTLLASNAVAKPGSDQADAAEGTPGVALVTAPPLPEPDPGQVAGLAAAASNSGLHPSSSGGALSEEQLAELVGSEPVGAPPVPAGDGVPPKAATVDVWRKWAVDSGKLTADEADGKNKGELQALAAE